MDRIKFRKRGHMHSSRTIIVMAALLVMASTPAFGDEPIETLRYHFNKGLAVMKDLKYQEEYNKSFQREELWKILQEAFDFTEISKRALARNWRKFSPGEKEAFSKAFTQLLGDTYISKIQGKFRDENVAYLSQQLVASNKAVVKTKIVRDTGDIPVNYSMKKRYDEWKVYDVKIEGVSLVKNYRSQFNRILIRDSPKELIEQVQRKAERNREKMLSMKVPLLFIVWKSVVSFGGILS